MVVVVDDLLKIRMMMNVKSVASFLSDTDSLSQGARSDSKEQAPCVNEYKIHHHFESLHNHRHQTWNLSSVLHQQDSKNLKFTREKRLRGAIPLIFPDQ